MREFRSKLPVILANQGFLVIPQTLETGDYVLSPNLIVERKSLSDLYQSLSSGRIYDQVANMLKWLQAHKCESNIPICPILLIEFDASEPFALQVDGGYLEVANSISLTVIYSKLSVLTLQFPALRILWARSPHHTAKLFRSLKEGQPEPVLETANAVELEEADQARAETDEVLPHMPGVHSRNLLDLKQMEGLHCLADLPSLAKQDLLDTLGTGPGSELFDFLHKTKR